DELNLVRTRAAAPPQRHRLPEVIDRQVLVFRRLGCVGLRQPGVDAGDVVQDQVIAASMQQRQARLAAGLRRGPAAGLGAAPPPTGPGVAWVGAPPLREILPGPL